LSDELAAGFAVKNTIPNVSAAVFRRSALLEALTEGMDEILSYRIAGDWAAYARVLEHGKLAFCPEALNRHRRHTASVTHGGDAKPHLLEVLRMQRTLRERHQVPEAQLSAARAYAERLYRSFGLATVSAPTLADRPELGSVRPASRRGVQQ
jgi:hypothetical protein